MSSSASSCSVVTVSAGDPALQPRLRAAPGCAAASRAGRLRRRTRRARRRCLVALAGEEQLLDARRPRRRSRAASSRPCGSSGRASRCRRRRTRFWGFIAARSSPATSSVIRTLHPAWISSVSSERPDRAAPRSSVGPVAVRVRRREAHRHPAVGDLGGERDVGRAPGGDEDRHVGVGVQDRLERLADADGVGAVVGEGDRLTLVLDRALRARRSGA